MRMSSSVADTSNHHEQDDLSAEVNQQAEAKESVEFNRHGEPFGPLATHFKARVGKFVNTYAPISYKTWSELPKNFKYDIWNAILPQRLGRPSTPMHIPDVAPISTPEVQPMPMHKEASRSSTPLPATMSNACRTLVGEGVSETSTRIEPTPTTRVCELLDWNKNVVAVAKEVTDPMHKGLGDFLVWPKVLIRFEELQH